MNSDVKCRLCPRMISVWRMFNMDGLCPECWENEPCQGEICLGCPDCEESEVDFA